MRSDYAWQRTLIIKRRTKGNRIQTTVKLRNQKMR